MHAAFSLLPLVAAVLAVPQFLPQLARLRRTGETAGVSWSWAALTSVNNAAWAGYFALSGFWAALVPAISATLLAGALAVLLARRTGFPRRPAVLVLAWAALLIAAAGLSGRAGLGMALTVAFGLQVTPSVWTAYRAGDTTGIATGTWLLIFGELLCWGVFGLYKSDPRLIVLGATGVTASLLVLARAARPRASRTGSTAHGESVTTSAASSYRPGPGEPPCTRRSTGASAITLYQAGRSGPRGAMLARSSRSASRRCSPSAAAHGRIVSVMAASAARVHAQPLPVSVTSRARPSRGCGRRSTYPLASSSSTNWAAACRVTPRCPASSVMVAPPAASRAKAKPCAGRTSANPRALSPADIPSTRARVAASNPNARD